MQENMGTFMGIIIFFLHFENSITLFLPPAYAGR